MAFPRMTTVRIFFRLDQTQFLQALSWNLKKQPGEIIVKKIRDAYIKAYKKHFKSRSSAI